MEIQVDLILAGKEEANAFPIGYINEIEDGLLDYQCPKKK